MFRYFNIEKDGEKTECRLDYDNYYHIWEKFNGEDYYERFDPKVDFPGLDLEKLEDEVILDELDVEYELGNGYTLDMNPAEHNVDFRLVREEKEDVLVPFSLIEDKDMREYSRWKWELPYFATGAAGGIFWDVKDHTSENYVCHEFWKDWEHCVNYDVRVEVNPADALKYDKGVVVRLSHQIIVKGYVDLEDEDFAGIPTVFWEDDQGFHDIRYPRDLDFDDDDWGDFYELIEYNQKRSATHEIGDWILFINEGDSNE